MIITELQAVNRMIRKAGERKVNSLYESVESDLASDILKENTNSVQSMGLRFNYQKDTTYTPDNNKFINIPNNVIEIISTDGSLVLRKDDNIKNKRLFNTSNNSYEFDSSVTVDAVLLFNFEEISNYHIQEYIVRLSIFDFLMEMGVSTNEILIAEKEAEKFFNIVNKKNIRNGKNNILG